MEYRIAEGADALNVEDVARLLKMTYWADKRPVAQIEESMRRSACFGVYLDGAPRLVGFARVISDLATTYYLCDVVIDEAHRHKGLGTALVSHIVSLPEYARLRGVLITRDAHALYQKFGFASLDGRAMGKPPA